MAFCLEIRLHLSAQFAVFAASVVFFQTTTTDVRRAHKHTDITIYCLLYVLQNGTNKRMRTFASPVEMSHVSSCRIKSHLNVRMFFLPLLLNARPMHRFAVCYHRFSQHANGRSISNQGSFLTCWLISIWDLVSSSLKSCTNALNKARFFAC